MRVTSHMCGQLHVGNRLSNSSLRKALEAQAQAEVQTRGLRVYLLSSMALARGFTGLRAVLLSSMATADTQPDLQHVIREAPYRQRYE